MLDLAELRVALLQLGELLARCVRRAIVDVDDLVGPASVERARDLRDQRRKIVLLVAHGHDDGDGNRCCFGRRQIHALGWLGRREPRRARREAYYGPGEPRATLLRRSREGPGNATMLPSRSMAKPRRRAANQ